jgi:hypothetical protein
VLLGVHADDKVDPCHHISFSLLITAATWVPLMAAGTTGTSASTAKATGLSRELFAGELTAGVGSGNHTRSSSQRPCSNFFPTGMRSHFAADRFPPDAHDHGHDRQ